VEVTPDGLSGLAARNFDMDADLLERITLSRKEFQEFVEGHWDHVLTAAFVFQIQPLDTLRGSGSATSFMPNHSSALLDFQ
jgi:hypothetical protein